MHALQNFLALTFFAGFAGSCGNSKPIADEKLRVCPEKYFEDRMPQIIDPKKPNKTPRAYFIYKGERREVAAFDTAWVWKNCEVEKQIVY